MRLLVSVLAAAILALAEPAVAATCGNDGSGFERWKVEFVQDAARAGINPQVAQSALSGVTYNRKVVSLDRNQKSFKLSFDQFYRKRVSNAMIKKGRRFIDSNPGLMQQIERRYGVPPEVIVSIWALETNFGGFIGNMSVVRSLATLAYDCRRSAFFTNELLAALAIIQRGDMQSGEMKGAWAGEIGQTQFLASNYIRYAVDFDGNGRRDLIRSVPDVLASTANYLRAYGWQPGQSWGPGTANYNVLVGWNKASVYVKTISVMAERMAAL